MIKTIIFDFDGTIINTNDVIIDAWQFTYKKYLGHEVSMEHITKCFGEPLLITMAREFPEIAPEESAAVYRQRQKDMADDLVSLFPGIKDLLVELKVKGYKLGIVTSRTKESTENYMRMFGIEDFFDGLVSCDDTTIHKPQPEPLLLGLKKLDTKKEEAIMVGDSCFDIKCANNAGVKSVMVGWRITDDNAMVGEYTVDYNINTPKELLEILI